MSVAFLSPLMNNFIYTLSPKMSTIREWSPDEKSRKVTEYHACSEILPNIGCHASTFVAEWPQQMCLATFYGLDMGVHKVTAKAMRFQRTL